MPVFAHVRNQVHLNHRQTRLCRASQSLLFPKVKVCGHLASSRSVDGIFPAASPHFVSVSHFGNSHDISNFSLFFIIFVLLICDQGSLMSPLYYAEGSDDGERFSAIKYFEIKVYTLFF